MILDALDGHGENRGLTRKEGAFGPAGVPQNVTVKKKKDEVLHDLTLATLECLQRLNPTSWTTGLARK